jgi:hypothetical protein
MHLAYGGIVFDIVRLNDWVRTLTRDESQTDFLYYEHKLDVDVVLNENATNAGDFAPVVSTGVVAYDTGRATPVGAPAVARSAKPAAPDLRWRGDLTEAELKDAVEASKLLQPPKGGFRTDLTPDELSALGAGGFTTGGDKDGFKKPKPDAPLKLNAVKPGPGGGVVGLATARQSSRSARRTVPWTDVELRERLRRPRQLLAVWMHTGDRAEPEYLLYSPHPGCGTDARTGPMCEVLGTQELHGNTTGVYRLSFVTWEAPALEFEFVQDPVPDGTASLATKSGQAGAKLRGGDKGPPTGGRLNAKAGPPEPKGGGAGPTRCRPGGGCWRPRRCSPTAGK